jgi:hypothetical protein
MICEFGFDAKRPVTLNNSFTWFHNYVPHLSDGFASFINRGVLVYPCRTIGHNPKRQEKKKILFALSLIVVIFGRLKLLARVHYCSGGMGNHNLPNSIISL